MFGLEGSKKPGDDVDFNPGDYAAKIQMKLSLDAFDRG